MGLSLHCVSSGIRTKDGVILSGVSYLVAVSVIPPAPLDPAASCSIVILDCTTDAEVATAKVLAYVATNDEVDITSSKHFCPALPIKAVNGLYLSGVSAGNGAGELVIVHCFSKDGNPIIAELA